MNTAGFNKKHAMVWAGIAALATVALIAQVTTVVHGSSAAATLPALPASWVVSQAGDPGPQAIAAPSRRDDPSRLRSELLIDAIVEVESAGQPGRVGRAGERGLMQIKKATWQQVTARMFDRPISFEQAFDPHLNRRVGRQYLALMQSYLLTRRDDWKADERALLLACYNAGPGRVLAAGFALDALPASTKDYITRVSALHDLYLSHLAAASSGVGDAEGAQARRASIEPVT